MSSTETIGTKLLRLKERSALPLEDIAKRGGYKGRSSVQKYFKPEYDGPLVAKAANMLAEALTGLGKPPITREEIVSLTGTLPVSNATPVKFEGATLARLQNDLPVYGTALGAEKMIDGEAIEQTTLNSAEVIEYRKRPTIANGMQRVYGLYVQGSSMYPAHRERDFLFVQYNSPFGQDDDVVVYLRPQGEADDGETASCVLIKRFVRRTAHYVELRQFQPDMTFRIATADILRIDRVLTNNDLA